MPSLPLAIETDNGKEFAGNVVVTWVYECGVQLRLIWTGRPNQRAYIDGSNGRQRDELLDEHWFPILLHVRASIET